MCYTSYLVTDFICFKCKSKIKTKRWGKSKIEVKCACPHEFDYIRTDDDDDAIEKFLTQFQLVNPEIDNIGESWTDSAAKYLEELWSTNPERLAKTELKNYLSKRFGRSVGAITSQLKHMKDSDTQKHESTEKSKIISEHQLPYELPKLPADNLDDDGNKNNDDWNDDYQDEYGFNSRNSQRLNQYAVISDRFCSTCKKNGIAHLVPDTNICDVCGASPPIILGPLACGRYWSPNQNNGSNYRNSLLSKYILDNKHENPAASNFLRPYNINAYKL